MPVYEYRHRSPQGKRTSGTIIADSPRHARDQLRELDIQIDGLAQIASAESNNLYEKATGSAGAGNKSGFGRLKLGLSQSLLSKRYSKHVSWFVRELSTLLSVGTPMSDALELTSTECPTGFRRIVQDIREHITTGRSLEQAVRRYDRVFEPILCELIGVGEQSGSLQTVLKQAAQFRDRRDKLKDKVLSSVLYPALVFVLSIAVTLFLMTFVVPTLISSLQELQKELPLPTRVLKAASDFLVAYGAPIGIAMLCLVSGFAIFIGTEGGRRRWDRFLLGVPLVGMLIRKQNCSRLCMVTGTLLQSGVELVRALEIAEGSVMNSLMRDAIREARQRLAAGMDVGTTLKANKAFPPALAQVFTLGQNTGQLDELLFRIAEDYDHQVATLSDRVTTVIEPLLIVSLSVIVGFILLATLLPILETGNALSEY